MAETEVDTRVPVERKLQALDSAPIGISLVDATARDNPLIYVNESFERLTGYDREEILGRNCRFLQGPDTDPATVRTLREHMDAAKPVSVVIRNYRADGEPFWNEVTIAPIRDENGDVTNFIGFQVDVTARKEAELRARAYREELEGLIERLHGLIQDVTELLMRSVARPETEQAICDRIVKAEPYAVAAFGELDLARNEVFLTSRCPEEPDGKDSTFSVDSDTAVSRAIEGRSVEVATHEDVPEQFAEDCPAIAIAPVSYGSRDYGVLIVGATDSDAFEGRERAVVEAVGQTVSIAINAAESQRMLLADNVAELEFVVSGESFPIARLAAECDAEFEYEGTITLSDERIAMCFSTTARPDDLDDELEDLESTSSLQVITEDDDRWLVAIEFIGDRFQRELAERGGELRTIHASPEETRLEVDVFKPANPRGIVEWITETITESELVAFRERERPASTKTDFIGTLEERLTDRQHAALQLAFASGYYDSRRSVTGSELASIMGISRATFHQHLRAAERKVLGEFLEAGGSGGRAGYSQTRDTD